MNAALIEPRLDDRHPARVLDAARLRQDRCARGARGRAVR